MERQVLTRKKERETEKATYNKIGRYTKSEFLEENNNVEDWSTANGDGSECQTTQTTYS